MGYIDPVSRTSSYVVILIINYNKPHRQNLEEKTNKQRNSRGKKWSGIPVPQTRDGCLVPITQHNFGVSSPLERGAHEYRVRSQEALGPV